MKKISMIAMILAFIATLCPVARAAPQKPLKVVLWLGGFAHDFKKVGEVLNEVLPKQRAMEISTAWNGDFLDEEGRPDVILMYHCHKSTEGVLTEAQKGKLMGLIHSGVGVVAVHASYYSFLEWDECHDKLYGARFIDHGKSEATLRVTPLKKHPIFEGIDKPIELVSELYRSTPLPDGCHLLGHSEEIGEEKAWPSIWTRQHGKGRIVTILPGHWVKNFRNPSFQRLILNSMDWTTGNDTPGKPVTSRHDWEEAALSSFTLPEGFEISLVAAEPHLANPISMTLDDAGRIYVSNAHSYRERWWKMNPAPDMEPGNPVVRLTPGPDGRAVDPIVVAEGFKNPIMGLAVRGQRLWASNLNRLFVTGLDAQGRMKGERKVLIRDSATPWNPFGMYRVLFGPDDLLYLSIGDHETQLTGTNNKSAVRLNNKGSGAVFRFHDDGSDLELLIEGMRAPFTVGFTPFGRLWVIANGEGSPNCLLNAIRGTDYRFRNGGRKDWSWLTGAEPLAAPVWETVPGAHTSVLPYYSSAFPGEYWSNLFVANFGVHGEPASKNEVLRMVLDDRGRVLRSEPFISSSDPRFRPTGVTLAPDGSLYLLDWYGKDDENDLTGRLYKVSYTGKKPESSNGLGSPNHHEREDSKNSLLAAGPVSSLPMIDKALAEEDALAAAEALWVLRRSGWAKAGNHIRKALSHHDWRVRRLAVQLMREVDAAGPDDLEKLMRDPDSAVQLEAALGFADATRRCTAVVTALRGGASKVRRLRFAAALEIAHHGQTDHFADLLSDDNLEVQVAGLIALDEAFYESSMGYTDEGRSPAQIARGVLARFIAAPGTLNSGALLDLARRWPHDSLKSSVETIVRSRLGKENVPASEFSRGLETLVSLTLPVDGDEIVRARIRLLDRATKDGFAEADEKVALLKVMEAGATRPEDLILLKQFVVDDTTRVRAKAFDMIASRHAGEESVVSLCRDLALNEQAGLASRLDAITTLPKLEKTLHPEVWRKLLDSPRPEIAIASLRALQFSGTPKVAARILDKAKPQLRERHGTAVADDLAFTSATLKGTTTAGGNEATLRREVLDSSGKPELGRLVFRARTCHNCHVASGGVLGPPLDHIAGTHDREYLLDSVLDPVKSVKTGFLTQMITLKSGEVITGSLRENVSGEGRWSEVTDQSGQRRIIHGGGVKSVTPVSVMPTGLEASMSKTELIDLIAYLETLR